MPLRNASSQNSVSVWLDALRSSDENAAQKLWERYFQRIERLAAKKLQRRYNRVFDEEDVAISAFRSLLIGIRGGRFPDLHDRDNLWALLVVITARKVSHRVRDERALRRGGGRVYGESVLGHERLGPDPETDDKANIGRVIGSAPSPEFALEVAEEAEALLDRLEDASLRQVALLRLEGYSNKEIAGLAGCALRTVERRLALIRKIWSDRKEG